MDPDLFAAVAGGAGGLLAVGAGVLIAAKHRASPRAQLERHPRRAFAEAREGIVRIQGTVLLGDQPPLRAPVTGRVCVAWELTLARCQQGGPFFTFHRTHEACDFSLLPQSSAPIGQAARVLASESQVALKNDTTGYSSSRREGTPQIGVQFSVSMGGGTPAQSASPLARPNHALLDYVDTLKLKHSYTISGYRYRERILAPDDVVDVMGVARWQTDRTAESADYRGVGRRLVVESGPDSPVVLVVDARPR